MNNADSLFTTFGAIGFIIFMGAIFVLALLSLLLPLFVLLINGKLKLLNQQMETLIASTGGNTTAKGVHNLTIEARTQSALLRQLLKASGHEPEA